MSSTDMKPLSLTLIVAATLSNAIGRESTLPWRLSKEMAYFARITKGEQQSSTSTSRIRKNSVIMGRKSWEGIPKKFRPLPERFNVVVTRQKNYDLGDSPSTMIAHSLESAIDVLSTSTSSSPSPQDTTTTTTTSNRIFLIGGAQLYNEALQNLNNSSSSYSVDRVLLTRIFTDYPNCDTFLHPFTEESKIWRKASLEEFREWAGWEIPTGIQSEKDRAYKGEEGEGDKIVEYEFQMWVRV
ncbi:hypothetical protein JCM3765_002566 [Sporobolomyces pararoseus]